MSPIFQELDQLRKQLAKTEKSGIKEAEKRKLAEEKAKALYDDHSAAISLAEETEEQRDEDKKLYEEQGLISVKEQCVKIHYQATAR